MKSGTSKTWHRELVFVMLFLSLFLNQLIAQSAGRGMQKVKYLPPVPELQRENIGYEDSWALVIGIDSYKYYPRLRTAVNGAKAFAEKLINDFGFETEKVITLYNENATKENIQFYLNDFFVTNSKRDDRLIIYFGGHGENYNDKIGYICPVNAEQSRITATGISMTMIKDFNLSIPVKHIFYIFDSCFSGFAFARGSISGIPEEDKRYYKKLVNTQSRQALTAGESQDLALDIGPTGNLSPFTFFLLQALDEPKLQDEYKITYASKVGQYVKERVSRHTGGKQNPMIDRFEESGNGELLIWKHRNFPIIKDYTFTFSNKGIAPLYKLIDRYAQKSGKKNFLFLFWDYYCLPCKSELILLSGKPIPEDMMVITINMDDPSNLKINTLATNLITRYNRFINFFTMDRNQINEILSNLNFQYLPHTLLVNSNKEILWSQNGFSSKSDQEKEQFWNNILNHMD